MIREGGALTVWLASQLYPNGRSMDAREESPRKCWRPRGLTALPEAHSGPAFATLAGLARFAASDPIDLRSLETTHQLVTKASPKAVFSRLMAAFRANY